jgi:hypothetical protein
MAAAESNLRVAVTGDRVWGVPPYGEPLAASGMGVDVPEVGGDAAGPAADFDAGGSLVLDVGGDIQLHVKRWPKT